MKIFKLHIALGALALLLFSCGGQKKIAKTEQAPPPEWVNNRPISPAYYIGIGASLKSREPLEYAQVAKKNALNDLASEISVEVKGQSFLNTLEVNKQFQEQFVSNISTSTRERVEGYDIMGTYETETEYFVYYRLSKAKHEMIRKERKDKTLAAANDFFLKGQDAVSNGRIATSIDMHVRALLEMKEYWTEVNEFVTSDGRTVYLDNEIYSSMRQLVQDIHIEPNLSSVVLNHANQYQQEVEVLVRLDNTPLSGMPVVYDYDRGKYMRPRILTTGPDGKVRIDVSEVNIKNKDNVLSLHADIEATIDKGLDRKLVKPLIEGLRVEKREVPIRMELPLAYIASSEKNFGQPMSGSFLRSNLQNMLSAQGFEFAAFEGQADYIIEITSNTTQGGTSQGFHVAYLEMTLTVKDTYTGNEVYRKAMSNVKGLQLNFDAAGLEAYKKGGKKLEDEIFAELLETIL